MPTTHLRALNTEAFKTNQDGDYCGFINGYFVYEVFYQEKGKLFNVNDYIIFWCFKLRCLLLIKGGGAKHFIYNTN
jgi:hypothetical protein